MRRGKKQHQQLHSNAGSIYSQVELIDNEEEESNNNLYDTKPKLRILVDDSDDSTDLSSSTDSMDEDEDHIPYSISSTQKQYAQTLKQIMEQELEEPEFGCMMDKIIRMLIYLAEEGDAVHDLDSAIAYLGGRSVQDAITDIGGLDEKLATDFTDSFTEKHENAAMEIMLQIGIKILKMRKLIADYPMIFVPISFQLYQPRFMTNKSERKHKLKKHKKHKKRQKSSQMAGVVVHGPTDRLNNYEINELEEENSISALSSEHAEELRDENINNKFEEKPLRLNNEDGVIQQTKSLPLQNNRAVLKQKRNSKRSKTKSANKLIFEKQRSGPSLVLLPIPQKRTSKIFGKNGAHFYDRSTVFKHRLSDVSKDQINIVRSSLISPSIGDIDEDDILDNEYEIKRYGSNNSAIIKETFRKSAKLNIASTRHLTPTVHRKESRKEQKKSMECNKLRKWTEAFVFKQVDEMTYNELMDEYVKKGQIIICEGCQTEIKLKDANKLNSLKLKKYIAGESTNGNDKFKKTFLFHDLYCETLRKYKEAIRQFSFEYEFKERYGAIPCDLSAADRYIHLFALKDDLLVVDSALSRNAKRSEDKKPHKPQLNGNFNQTMASHSHSRLAYVGTTDAGLRRERRLALLNLYREAESRVQLLPTPNSINALQLSLQRSIQQFDDEINDNELPELLRYIDVTTFGRPLWYFCVDQLSTKDRQPLWHILEFLATELPTSLAINLLKATRDALVRFHVEPLDNVCLKIIAASTYPIATALFLAAFMQSNANSDSSRADKFNEISNKYINIGTHLLSQIESDHLLAILIEIPSNIDGLSILDIVIRFKLEVFLEFHRLQPIFMNMWMQYQYLDPSKPFRNREADSLDILQLCFYQSALFYYSPIGAFTLQCTTYICHVILVSFVTVQLLYPYKEPALYEWVVWIFNAGFVLYEISELTIRRFGYFQYYSNWIGFIISINWIILAVIRFYTYYNLLDSYYHEICPDVAEFDNVCFHNAPITKLYMIFWSIQVILLWSRIAALLQRNKHCGPLLRMIMNMMVEISSFALLLFLFVFGFVLAVFYIVGGDVEPTEEFGGLNRLSSVFLYHIQGLLAAQEWGAIVSDEEDGFDSDRSIMVETCMVLLSIFGTLLLMNLFIALLTITYEAEKQNARLKTNFARITHTIELDKKSAVMPPPLNLLVFALTILFWSFDCILILFSCAYWTMKLQALYPIKYSLKQELEKKEKESKHKRKGSIYNNNNLQNQTEHKNDLFEISKDVTLQNQSRYLMDNVYCGCFVRLSTKSKKNKCKNLTLTNDKYCRHCRHSLSNKGNIDRYFDLFKYWQLLDEDDKALLRLRLSCSTHSCPHCFRSYSYYQNNKKIKHGLNRFEVMLEVMSYYVFKILIWWWLLIILSIPALITQIYKRLNHNYSHSEQNSNFQSQIITNAYQKDPNYKSKVDQVIKLYDNNNCHPLIEKQKQKQNKEKLPMDSIEHKTDDKLDKIETQINDLRYLILRQQQQQNTHLNLPPINKTKKVSFSPDPEEKGHKQRQTQMQPINMGRDEYEYVINDNEKITPRIVSHARSKVPMHHVATISDLDIGHMLARQTKI